MEGRGGRKRRLVQIWRQTQEGKRVLCRTLDMTQERDASGPSSGRNNAAILAEKLAYARSRAVDGRQRRLLTTRTRRGPNAVRHQPRHLELSSYIRAKR